jgi:hypothetical protein
MLVKETENFNKEYLVNKRYKKAQTQCRLSH